MAGMRPFFRAPLRVLFQPRSLRHITPLRSYSQPGTEVDPGHYCVFLENSCLSAPLQSESSRPLGFPWRVVVAVCVQRLPTLSKETVDVERRYHELKVRVASEFDSAPSIV